MKRATSVENMLVVMSATAAAPPPPPPPAPPPRSTLVPDTISENGTPRMGLPGGRGGGLGGIRKSRWRQRESPLLFISHAPSLVMSLLWSTPPAPSRVLRGGLGLSLSCLSVALTRKGGRARCAVRSRSYR